MKKALLLLVLAGALIAGCGGGGSLKDKIVGTWKFDVDTLQAQNLTPELKKLPQFDALKKIFEPVRITFKADGTYTATQPLGKAESGKWTLTDKVIVTTADKPEDDKGKPKFVVSDNGSTIHTTAGEGDKVMEMDMVKAG